MVIEGLARLTVCTARILQHRQLEARGWGVESRLTRVDTDESLPKHSSASYSASTNKSKAKTARSEHFKSTYTVVFKIWGTDPSLRLAGWLLVNSASPQVKCSGTVWECSLPLRSIAMDKWSPYIFRIE
jgi:hypothetical protein